MVEKTRSRTSKAKPRAKAKPKAKASARKPSAPAKRTRVATPTPLPMQPVTPVIPVQTPSRSNSLAVAAIVCAGANFTFVPVLGGFLAAGLGAVAVDRERRAPDRYTGRGLAKAAVYIGLLTAVLPVAFVTLFASEHITPIPFVAVSAFAAWVVRTGMRGSSGGQKLAVLGGGLVITVVSVALAIGLALGFYFLMRHISIEIGSAIGDAFSQMFDGIGDAFGSCGDALDI